MLEVVKILTRTLETNVVWILLLSISWVLVYLLMRLVRDITSKLFIRYPYHVYLRAWRSLSGVNKAKEMLLSGKAANSVIADDFANRIDAKMGSMDEVLSNFSRRRNIANIFFSRSLLCDFVGQIVKRDLIFLERDHSFFGVFSSHKDRRESSILSLLGNPAAKEAEIRVALYHLIKSEKSRLGAEALYHLLELLRTPADVNEIKGIVSDWPKDLKEPAEEKLKILEDRMHAKEGVINLEM